MSHERDQNFWADIVAETVGEPIEGVVIGGLGWSYNGEQDDDDPREIAVEHKGHVLTAAEAEPLLSYAYDSGFGGADCHAVWVWTAHHVLSVHEYDGSTHVISVPRNPTDVRPEMC